MGAKKRYLYSINDQALFKHAISLNC